MSNEPKFVDGLRAYAPRENAPDFVKANLVINIAELQGWLAQRSGEVRIDIKESRGGKYYASENDYKPEGQRQQSQQAPSQQPDPKSTVGALEDDGIPF